MTFASRSTLLFLLALYAVLCFYRLGSWGVLETSEARYAAMGREMYLSGDYLHPTFTGLRHYHKPPLTYTVTALAYRLFGVSAWSARIFLQLALLALAGHEVYMVNRELPELAFHFQTPMIRLYEGDMPRDTSRQVAGRWRERWYDVSCTEVMDFLARRWTTTPTVVITADAPSAELAPRLTDLGHTDRVGRYYIFYNSPSTH